jgi:DNA-binding winged helix-turn-helix (wHTH) protein/Tol biopolymer transport system component
VKGLKSTIGGDLGDEGRGGDCYAFGPFRLDCRTRQLSRNGEVVGLTPKAFDTLRALVTRRDRVVEKDELMKLVWPDSFVGEDSLTQNIATLRKALGDPSDQPQFIATVPRRGYRFIAAVQAPQGETPLVTPIPGLADAIEGGAPAPTDTRLRDQHRMVPEDPSRDWASQTWWVPMWLAISTIGIVVAMILAITSVRRAQPTPPSRFVVSPDRGATLTSSSGSLSPDGRHLAFVAQDSTNMPLLWVRDLDSLEARKIVGTDDAWAPFWSPDSQFIGFFAQGTLKRVGRSGAALQTLATDSIAATPAGGTWNAQELILFAGRRSGLFSVPATGGTPTPITSLDPSAQEFAHRWPQFLPDGRHFLYLVISGDRARQGVYVGSLGSSAKTRVLLADSAATYATPGYLFFVRQRALMAQPFDVDRLQVSGAPALIADGVSPSLLVPNGLPFSTSNRGVLAYSVRPASKLTWFTRAGERLGALETQAELHNPILSLDGKWLAATTGGTQEGPPRIWLFDMVRGVSSPLVSDGTLPVWSPDGTQVVFSSLRGTGVQDLYLRSPRAWGGDVLLARTGRSMRAQDWSLDGRFVVFSDESPDTKVHLWLLPLFGDRKPVPYLQTNFNELQGQVSPDGHSMAYASDESGSWEVYVGAFPVAGAKQRVSAHGGSHPKWRRDGKELFYVAPDHTLMAVEVNTSSPLHIEAPKPLFRIHTGDDVVGVFRDSYAVAGDGQKFLIDTTDEQAGRTGVTILVNWIATLGK